MTKNNGDITESGLSATAIADSDEAVPGSESQISLDLSLRVYAVF
ncbi:hypothetical protein [Nostoc flagelliforme]|nr:hypothetical protein [Nostoc flagelliforme]